jgi:hypothetical protein
MPYFMTGSPSCWQSMQPENDKMSLPQAILWSMFAGVSSSYLIFSNSLNLCILGYIAG